MHLAAERRHLCRKAQARPIAGKSIQEDQYRLCDVMGRSRWPRVDRQPPDDHHSGEMNMKMLIAAVTLGTVIAAPAFAQSYDPDLGSGNVSGFTAGPAYAWSVDQDAFAQVVPGK